MSSLHGQTLLKFINKFYILWAYISWLRPVHTIRNLTAGVHQSLNFDTYNFYSENVAVWDLSVRPIEQE